MKVTSNFSFSLLQFCDLFVYSTYRRTFTVSPNFYVRYSVGGMRVLVTSYKLVIMP